MGHPRELGAMGNDETNAIKSTKHKESFVRWQAITIGQLGYAINLILGFATASLGFAFIQVKDITLDVSCWGKVFLTLSILSFLISVIFGIVCVINRLRDFRRTKDIASCREDWQREEVPVTEIDNRLRQRREEVKKLGKWTWRLFYCQIGSFTFGIVLLALALTIIYHARLF